MLGVVFSMRCTIRDECGAVVLRDRTEWEPPANARESRTELRAVAKEGRLFFLDRQDPVARLVVEVTSDDLDGIEGYRLFESLGGNFLLQLPSGGLIVSGLEAWCDGQGGDPSLTLEPGPYVVVVYSRENFDPAVYDEEMAGLVGRNQWVFLGNVDKLCFLGCLPTVVALVVVAVASLQLGAYFAGAAVLLWAPFVLGRWSKRYKATAARIAAYEKQLPDFILQLRRVDGVEGLSGGFVL